MSILRAVGDLHGCIDNRNRFPELPSYVEICQELESDDYSVQLGDCGFEYRDLELVDSNKNRILLGNHCNYDIAFDYPHMLGHYGVAELGPFSFFYIRGGFSLDKAYRVKHERLTGQKSWWPEEELTQKQGKDAIDMYESVKPNIVLSHDTSSGIAFLIGNPDILTAFGIPRSFVGKTQSILQQCFDIHQPELHIFGHFHKDWEIILKGTHHICINERRFIDFDEQWNVVEKSK